MLEIELSESLKRKRDELRTKIDSLSHIDTDDLESSGADLAAKTQELEALNDSITSLQERIAGTPPLCCNTLHANLGMGLQRLKSSMIKLQPN